MYGFSVEVSLWKSSYSDKKIAEKKWLFWKRSSSKKAATLKKCAEVAFPKIKLSENIVTNARREIAIDPDKYSLGISCEFLTRWP